MLSVDVRNQKKCSQFTGTLFCCIFCWQFILTEVEHILCIPHNYFSSFNCSSSCLFYNSSHPITRTFSMPGTKEVSFHCKVESSCPHKRSINGDRDLYQALYPSLNWTWCLIFLIFLDKWSFTVLSKARTALESCLRSCDTYDTLGYSFPTSFFLTLVIADNWVDCCLFVLPMGRLYFVLIKVL